MILWLTTQLCPFMSETLRTFEQVEQKIFGKAAEDKKSRLLLAPLFNFNLKEFPEVNPVVIDLLTDVQGNFDRETLEFLLKKVRLHFPNGRIFVCCYETNLKMTDENLQQLITIIGNKTDPGTIEKLKSRKDEMIFVRDTIQAVDPQMILLCTNHLPTEGSLLDTYMSKEFDSNVIGWIKSNLPTTPPKT